jgi:protoporphyrinogen oxidase
MSAHVVVVGAGLSGLTAAYRLRQAGCRVTVLERESFPGGRVRTESHGPYLVDTGPDAMTESYVRYLALIEEFGLSDRVVRCSQVAGLVRDRRVIDIDLAKPWTLPTTPALSFGAKLRLLRGMARIRRELRGVDPYDMAASADFDDPGTNAREYALGHFGTEVTDYLVDPMMRLVCGSGADQASRLGLLGAVNGWSVPLINIMGGLSLLPDTLASKVDVDFGATVTEVAETVVGVRVRYEDAAGEHLIDADACVIGAMYHVAERIWAPLGAYVPAFGRALHNVGFVSVSLGYAAEADTRAYVVQVPTAEYPDALLIFMQHHKAPDRAPAGHSLVTMYTDNRVTGRYLDRSDEEITAWAAGIVETVCPELTGRRDMAAIRRWPVAGYLAAPGFWRRSRDLLAGIPADSRVKLAGDLFGAGSMESAVAWGERAATAVLGLAQLAGAERDHAGR